MRDITGVFIVDKEPGFTSFDVVAILRGLLGTKKVGHTGTLDPIATGVLPVLVGRATRAEAILPDTEKEYLAGFCLGLTTDTQDITGAVLRKREARVSLEQLEAACGKFRGDILQLPPMYSAVKKNGEKLYELARRGIEVEREPRPVRISRLEIMDFDPLSGRGSLAVSCSKGTYIRTLCHDIGNALGCGGVMTSLRRTKASGFSLESALTIGLARKLAAEEKLEEALLPVEQLFLCYPELSVTEGQTIRFQNGGALALDRLEVPGTAVEGSVFRVKSPSGGFVGLGCVDTADRQLKILRLF